MNNPSKDERYTVSKEYTGEFHQSPIKGLKQGQMYVARFCGDWIGCDLTENLAWLMCIYYDDERNFKIL